MHQAAESLALAVTRHRHLSGFSSLALRALEGAQAEQVEPEGSKARRTILSNQVQRASTGPDQVEENRLPCRVLEALAALEAAAVPAARVAAQVAARAAHEAAQAARAAQAAEEARADAAMAALLARDAADKAKDAPEEEITDASFVGQ